MIAADRLAGLWRIQEYLSMTQKHSPPQLTPREYKDGRGWYIEATSDVGITENLGDFTSEFEANDWIVRKSTAYFKARQK
jgi:hypothetical protein